MGSPIGSARGLIVSFNHGAADQVSYDLRAKGDLLRPETAEGDASDRWPVLESGRLLFGRRAMSSSCPKGTPTSPYLQLASPGTTARGLAADAAGLERALGAVRATFLSVIGPSLKEVPVHG